MTDIVLRQTSWKPATAEEFARVEFEVQTPSRNYEVFIAGDGIQQQQGLEAGVPLALLAAMHTGNNLRVEGALSETFLQGVERYMEIYTQAFPIFKPIKILPSSKYKATSAASHLPKRRGSFFSGGVDSFYTLFKGAGEITDIIYIHGFDVRLDDLTRRAAIDKMANEVATELGITYRAVESNMGKVLQDFGNWKHAHGLALIAVIRLMAGTLNEIRIPSSYSVSEQQPSGSWLLTDHLFSDERIRVVHDACEARRVDKIKSLAAKPLFLRHVRVCWERVDGMYNCCRCEKCLRTMTSLSILGTLEQATAFSLPLDVARVAAVCLPRPDLRKLTQENLTLLQESEKHMPELEKALKKQLNRPVWLSHLRLKWRKRLQRWQRLPQRYLIKKTTL